jgi:hypothetical protein
MSVYTNVLSDEAGDAGIHIGQLGDAISVWAWMQDGDEPQTVATAALTFNTTPALVRQAIAIHPWVVLTGKQRIEHDGE